MQILFLFMHQQLHKLGFQIQIHLQKFWLSNKNQPTPKLLKTPLCLQESAIRFLQWEVSLTCPLLKCQCTHKECLWWRLWEWCQDLEWLLKCMLNFKCNKCNKCSTYNSISKCKWLTLDFNTIHSLEGFKLLTLMRRSPKLPQRQ